MKMRMDLNSLNKFWDPIEETLDNLTTKSPEEVKSWFVTETCVSAYSLVHISCVAPGIVPPPIKTRIKADYFHSRLIYECLKGYMTMRFKEVSLGIASKRTPEEAFDSYMQAHCAFETYRKLIEKMFHYIQHHWVDLVRGDSRVRTKVLSIETLLVSLWLQLVVEPNLPLILNGAKNEVKTIRELKLQESRVADFINFVSSYSQDQELPLCAIFNEALVQLYEEDLKKYLAAFASANSLDSELDVSKCELIIVTWLEEMERIKASFGNAKDLVKKYKRIMRKCLLEPSGSSIESVIADSLRSSHTNQSLISGAYKIYSAYTRLRPRLVQLFEQVLTERVTSKPVNDTSHILECMIWAASLLKDCFEDDEDCSLIRFKVFRSVFSGNTGSTD